MHYRWMHFCRCHAGPRAINQHHAASVYKSLNFGDLEPMGMTIQLANRSVVNDLIFLADFYVLDMEDESRERDLP
ncbi:hypothetical protein CR513_26082, partial [Mucuna pruriens]